MSDRAPVAIAISEESGRRVELHDDRVARAFRAFDDYRVHEIVPDGGDDETYWLTSSKNETHECPLCGDEDIGQLPTHMRACDGDSEGVDRGEGVETDGGQNTYLVDDEQWFLVGLIENALSRREEGRWEACRRLVQQALARLDRGTRAHRLVRDGCCSSHPSSSQWRDSLERAKTALEVCDA